MDRIRLARIDINNGIAISTRKKQTSQFARWKEFHRRYGIDDPFLTSYTTQRRGEIVCAFANEVRNNRLGRTSQHTLRGSTVETAIANVVSVFKENHKPDPTTDSFGNRILPLRRQLKGYKDQDLPTKRQCCLPLAVFHHMSKTADTPSKRAISDLTHGALTFAMRFKTSLVKKDNSF